MLREGSNSQSPRHEECLSQSQNLALEELKKHKAEQQQQQKLYPVKATKTPEGGEKSEKKRNQMDTFKNDFSKRVLRWAKQGVPNVGKDGGHSE